MYTILYDLMHRLAKLQSEHPVANLAVLILFWGVVLLAWIRLQDVLAGAT